MVQDLAGLEVYPMEERGETLELGPRKGTKEPIAEFQD
jgi:hypothetical protein